MVHSVHFWPCTISTSSFIVLTFGDTLPLSQIWPYPNGISIILTIHINDFLMQVLTLNHDHVFHSIQLASFGLQLKLLILQLPIFSLTLSLSFSLSIPDSIPYQVSSCVFVQGYPPHIRILLLLYTCWGTLHVFTISVPSRRTKWPQDPAD